MEQFGFQFLVIMAYGCAPPLPHILLQQVAMETHRTFGLVVLSEQRISSSGVKTQALTFISCT